MSFELSGEGYKAVLIDSLPPSAIAPTRTLSFLCGETCGEVAFTTTHIPPYVAVNYRGTRRAFRIDREPGCKWTDMETALWIAEDCAAHIEAKLTALLKGVDGA